MPFPFLKLPAELRQLVYHHLSDSTLDDPIKPQQHGSRHPNSRASLIRANHQTWNECHSFFYESNVFSYQTDDRFYSPLMPVVQQITASGHWRYLNLIQHVHITHSEGWGLRTLLKLIDYMRPRLSALKVLRITFEEECSFDDPDKVLGMDVLDDSLEDLATSLSKFSTGSLLEIDYQGHDEYLLELNDAIRRAIVLKLGFCCAIGYDLQLRPGFQRLEFMTTLTSDLILQMWRKSKRQSLTIGQPASGQFFSCEVDGQQISVERFKGLLAALPESVREEMQEFDDGRAIGGDDSWMQ